MRTSALRGAALTMMLLWSGTAALPCGDKLLAITRGVRFQHVNAARQANLVIYSGAIHHGAVLDSAKLQTTLKRTVHTLQVVHGGSQLEQALKSGRVDVVLVYFTDVNGITRQLQAAPSMPVVLPVLIGPSKADFIAAQKAFKYALKANADELEYLSAIDEAMKSKGKTAARS